MDVIILFLAVACITLRQTDLVGSSDRPGGGDASNMLDKMKPTKFIKKIIPAVG